MFVGQAGRFPACPFEFGTQFLGRVFRLGELSAERCGFCLSLFHPLGGLGEAGLELAEFANVGLGAFDLFQSITGDAQRLCQAARSASGLTQGPGEPIARIEQ